MITAFTEPRQLVKSGFLIQTASGLTIFAANQRQASQVRRLLGGTVSRGWIAHTTTAKHRGCFGTHRTFQSISRDMDAMCARLNREQEAEELREAREELRRARAKARKAIKAKREDR